MTLASREYGVAIDSMERQRFALSPHQWPAYVDSRRRYM